MKKNILWIASLSLLLIFSGCTIAAKKSELNQEKKIEDIAIKPQEFKLKQDDSVKSKNSQFVYINVNVNNQSKTDVGIGAGDFYLENKAGEKITNIGYYDSFGMTIKPNAKTTGNIYFMIPKSQKKYTLIYKRLDGKKLSWNLVLK